MITTLIDLSCINEEVLNLPHSQVPSGIVIQERSDDIQAYILGEPEVWACGKTAREAIGNLIMSYSERFAILPPK